MTQAFQYLWDESSFIEIDSAFTIVSFWHFSILQNVERPIYQHPLEHYLDHNDYRRQFYFK